MVRYPGAMGANVVNWSWQNVVIHPVSMETATERHWPASPNLFPSLSFSSLVVKGGKGETGKEVGHDCAA